MTNLDLAAQQGNQSGPNLIDAQIAGEINTGVPTEDLAQQGSQAPKLIAATNKNAQTDNLKKASEQGSQSGPNLIAAANAGEFVDYGPLRITAINPGQVSLLYEEQAATPAKASNNSTFDLEYSLNGEDWTPWDLETDNTNGTRIFSPILLAKPGDSVYLRGNNTSFDNCAFVSVNTSESELEDQPLFKASGSVQSLVCKDPKDERYKQSVIMRQLFCEREKNIELSGDRYASTLYLTEAPALTAETLILNGYTVMFNGQIFLEKPADIPNCTFLSGLYPFNKNSTVLVKSNFEGIYAGCSRLKFLTRDGLQFNFKTAEDYDNLYQSVSDSGPGFSLAAVGITKLKIAEMFTGITPAFFKNSDTTYCGVDLDTPVYFSIPLSPGNYALVFNTDLRFVQEGTGFLTAVAYKNSNNYELTNEPSIPISSIYQAWPLRDVLAALRDSGGGGDIEMASNALRTKIASGVTLGQLEKSCKVMPVGTNRLIVQDSLELAEDVIAFISSTDKFSFVDASSSELASVLQGTCTLTDGTITFSDDVLESIDYAFNLLESIIGGSTVSATTFEKLLNIFNAGFSLKLTGPENTYSFGAIGFFTQASDNIYFKPNLGFTIGKIDEQTLQFGFNPERMQDIPGGSVFAFAPIADYKMVDLANISESTVSNIYEPFKVLGTWEYKINK